MGGKRILYIKKYFKAEHDYKSINASLPYVQASGTEHGHNGWTQFSLSVEWSIRIKHWVKCCFIKMAFFRAHEVLYHSGAGGEGQQAGK